MLTATGIKSTRTHVTAQAVEMQLTKELHKHSMAKGTSLLLRSLKRKRYLQVVLLLFALRLG